MDEQTKPLWQPSDEVVGRSNLNQFQAMLEQDHGLSFGSYEALHRWSITAIDAFWQAVWDYCEVIASQPATQVLTDPDSILNCEWFPGAKLNFAENMLRYKDDKPALVSVLEDGTEAIVSYRELHDRVQAFAAGLKQVGVEQGDRVGGVLPNDVSTVVAMLATTSLGGIWTCCSPDFGVDGILDRFSQTEPKVLVGCDQSQYNGKQHDCRDKLISVAKSLPSVTTVVVTGQAPEGQADQDFDVYSYDAFSRLSDQPLEFAQLPFDHPVYILYSSGTTGKPKCIVHGAGGTLLQHIKGYVLHYDVNREDAFFYYSTTGWTMWNILASALVTGCKVILYDGSPFFPEPERLIDLIDRHGISVFGVSAKYIGALEKAGVQPLRTHQLESLRMILSTGSPLSPESYDYVYREVKADLCLGSICGGTDIISAFIEAAYTLPVHAGRLQCKGLGMAVEIWNEDGQPVIDEKGELVCTRPFPSRPVYFWNDPENERYKKAYFSRFPGVWAQGDFGEQDSEGRFVIHGRSDAVLNPGGVRIGTAEIYRQVEQFEDVLDAVCVGQRWGGDVRVVLFVILRDGIELDDALIDQIKQKIRSDTTPRHVPVKIIQVRDIPRTISGKNVEIAVRDVVHGEQVKNVESLANPEALELFREIPALSD